jgi:6-phosphofructokinase
VLQAHDVRYFLYSGGNDSADTAWKVSQLADAFGYPLHCIGVPKTIDNDLAVTDTCPGFGSAAKYTAVSVREAALDVAAMAETSTKVFVYEAMGRHAGWLAAAAGLAAQSPDDAPQIILFPERAYDEAAFLAQVRKVVDKVAAAIILQRWLDAQHNAAAQAETQEPKGEETMSENQDSSIIELIDENGQTVQFEHVATLEHEGAYYIALMLLDEDHSSEDDEGELVLMKIDTDDKGEECYVAVEDEDLQQVLFDKCMALLDEEFNGVEFEDEDDAEGEA